MISQKYDNNTAAAYRQLLLAKREGKSDSIDIPKFVSSNTSGAKSGKEIEAEARARMAAKFGTGGLGKGIGTGQGCSTQDNSLFSLTMIAVVVVVAVAAAVLYYQ